MGKKKHKSRNSVSNDSASFLNVSDKDSLSSSFISINTSNTAEDVLPEKFIVTSVQSSKCATYAKCLKTDFENIIFVNSLVLQSCLIEDLVLVQGEENQQLCTAHALKNLKRHLVVFPKSKCGFHYDEFVTLQPYNGKIRHSGQILIFSSDDANVSQDIQDYILRLLSNKYIYIGMTIKFILLDRRYVFIIEDILPSGDLSSSSLTEPSNESPVFYMVTFTTSLKLKSDAAQEEESNSYEKIGGLEKQIMQLKKYFQLFLMSGINFGSMFCGTLIFQGPPGTGKSLLLQAITKSCKVHIEHVWWYNLYAIAPSLIVIDELNNLCPDKTEAENSQLYVSKLLPELLQTIDDSKVMIIAATNDSNFDESILRTRRRLMDVIKIKIPSNCERLDILKKLLDSKIHDLTSDQIQECAELAHGFTGRDLADAVNDAEMVCNKRGFPVTTNSSELFHISRSNANTVCKILYIDLKLAMKLKKPTIVAANDLIVKKVQWSDIGGMAKVKEKLKQLVEWPLKYPEAFKHFNISPSRGVLLYGPPGCSKTMIAKALATECELNFISKNASDLFDKYVGESEKAVRMLFGTAKAKAPCIIFLDEIDALVAERGSSSTSSGVGDRIVTTFLTEMDGIEELHGVIIIAATNRPDMLDDALVRNGRINHFIYVALPDASTREEILKINMANRTVSKDFDYKLLSLKTEGYSGAEIVNICNEAALQLLAENPKAESPIFSMSHFDEALKQVFPRTSKKIMEFYESFNEQHCTNVNK